MALLPKCERCGRPAFTEKLCFECRELAMGMAAQVAPQRDPETWRELGPGKWMRKAHAHVGENGGIR